MLKAIFLFHLQEHDLDEERSQVYLFTFSYVMHYLSFLDTDAAISDIKITTDYWPDKPICFSRQFACQMRLWLIFYLLGSLEGSWCNIPDFDQYNTS